MRSRHLNPLYWIDRFFDKMAEVTMRREALSVTEGQEGLQKIFRVMVVRAVVIFGGIIGYDYVPEGVRTWLFVAMCGGLSLVILSGFNRATAYRRGWMDGRQRMVHGIKQHDNWEDWLDTEANYDLVHVLGLPPMPHPRGGGDEPPR